MTAPMKRMANLFVANTDYNWFEFLSHQGPLDEVNFWQPSGKRQFRALQPGELFVFKLKAPHNKIAGYGLFAESSLLPLSLAWQTFGIKNGRSSYAEMRDAIRQYKGDDNDMIGFRVVTQPVFWPRNKWIDIPTTWPHNLPGGMTFATDSAEGRRLWDAIHERADDFPVREFREAAAPMFGDPVQVRPRLGQGAFRIGIIEAYGKRCMVTGERTVPALEAAHIVPVSESGTHELTNGLLLRKDIHALFDLHYVTITPEMRFEVSKRIKEEFENGRHYYALHGARVASPIDNRKAPSPVALKQHNARFIL